MRTITFDDFNHELEKVRERDEGGNEMVALIGRPIRLGYLVKLESGKGHDLDEKFRGTLKECYLWLKGKNDGREG